MHPIRPLLLSLAVLLLSTCNQAENEAPQPTSSPPHAHDAKEHSDGHGEGPAARAFFIEPQAGQTVSAPVKVKMGIEGMKIESAGQAKPHSGHYHLIVNAGPVPEGQPVPSDENHLHFADGQTETQLQLKPGTYKLTLQVADGSHRSLGKAMSQTISVTVK